MAARKEADPHGRDLLALPSSIGFFVLRLTTRGSTLLAERVALRGVTHLARIIVRRRARNTGSIR